MEDRLLDNPTYPTMEESIVADGVGRDAVAESALNYRDLRVWHAAIELATRIYTVTQRFPKEEQYGLTIQLRRAAVSVPSNIAEGNARKHLREYLNFLSIAQGSLAEIDTQLVIASRLSFISTEDFDPLIEAIRCLQRQIQSMKSALERRQP